MEVKNSISVNSDLHTKSKRVNALLDGLLEHHKELGELGEQLVLMLRFAGIKATIDPVMSKHYH